MRTPRDHLPAAEMGGLVHVLGGRSAALGATGSAHEVYDLVANSWTNALAFPTGRGGIGAAALGGRIHVLGGEADHTFDQNEAYDPASDSWFTFTSLPTAPHGSGVVSVGDAIYVVGGGPQPGDSRSNIVEVFRLS
jgi:N-acetylneuraminic acid mutarotase